MRYGTVVSWNARKGFGFIRPDRGLDVFFHISALGACEAAPPIVEGQAVKYEVDPKSLPKRKSFKQRIEDAKNQRLEDAKSKPAEEPENPRATMVELIDKIPGAALEESTREQLRVQHHPKARRKKPTWRK